MNPILKFFLKLFVFVTAVLALQIFISQYIAPLPETQRLNASLRVGHKIVAFGDSQNWNIAAQDTDRSNQVEMTAKAAGVPIGNLGHPGYHLDIYAAETEYLARSPRRPGIIILPIQLRSFSPEWDLRPVNQFEREIFTLSGRNAFLAHFYTPLAILRAVDTNAVPYTSFLNAPVYRGTVQVGVVNDFEAVNKLKPGTEENIRDDFVYKYMGAIDPAHRKLVSLARLLDTARAAHMQIYAYIPPVDHETGTKYLGKEFDEQISANAKLICDFLEARGERCLDLSSMVPADGFDYPSYPNEHLNQKGRALVADRIVSFYFLGDPGSQ